MSVVYNIVIIGAGQLGSRHLQGVKTADIKMDIFVVDPNQNNLNISQERYEQIPVNPLVKSVSYLTDISLLPTILDVVIIATGSKPRAEIIRNLLLHNEVEYLILEKVLFPSLHEYKEIGELLERKQIKTWVNCSRRIFEHYKVLAGMISSSIRFDVIGKNWGLACNAIHFLDLFTMFSGEQDFSLDAASLGDEIYPSKRDGYIEFAGTIKGIASKGSSFSISSLKEYELPTTISIKSKGIDVLINESGNYMLINGEKKIIETPFQSQLTGRIVEQVLLHGELGLPFFQESSRIHQQFLTPLVKFYNKLTGNTDDTCPIT